MAGRMEVVPIEDSQWDKLVATSPQGSPFNRREFLAALGTRILRLGVLDGSEVVAGVALQFDPEGAVIGPPRSFGYCQGILLSSSIAALPEHSRCRKELAVTQALVEGLTAAYSDLWLGLHWQLRDLRALQWLNYHEPSKGQFRLTLRYTGILDLSRYSSIADYIASLGKGRRGDERRASKAGISVRESRDVDILEHLHQLTFERQGADRGILERQLKPMAQAALDNGFGDLLVAFTRAGEPVSAALFIRDERTSHYLFGASDPGLRDSGGNTAVIVENVARAMARGIRLIDFVGINSPQRGDFKTSFNAAPASYCEAEWHLPR